MREKTGIEGDSLERSTRRAGRSDHVRRRGRGRRRRLSGAVHEKGRAVGSREKTGAGEEVETIWSGPREGRGGRITRLREKTGEGESLERSDHEKAAAVGSREGVRRREDSVTSFLANQTTSVPNDACAGRLRGCCK